MDNSYDNEFSPEFSNDGYPDENTEVDVGDNSSNENRGGLKTKVKFYYLNLTTKNFIL